MTIIMSVTTEELKLSDFSDMKMLNKRKQQQLLSLGSYIFQCHTTILYIWNIITGRSSPEKEWMYSAVGSETYEVCIFCGYLLAKECMYPLFLTGTIHDLKLTCFVIVSASQILLTSPGQTCETWAPEHPNSEPVSRKQRLLHWYTYPQQIRRYVELDQV